MTTDAEQVLKDTSRTFFIPIQRLPDRLREAVSSAYLCMRSIDEIEDQRSLDPESRVRMLRGVSEVLQSASTTAPFSQQFEVLFAEHADSLPSVTLRISEWAALAPEDIRPRVWESTATMADRMAGWVGSGFAVRTEADLDRYTYAVAGAVGVLLSDLWMWFDGTPTDRTESIAFGRGLQAVNILRNREEDLEAGVDFFPDGWSGDEMQVYARKNLGLANRYVDSLREGPVRDFCSIPLLLAHATVDALAEGRKKLEREEVEVLVSRDARDVPE